MMTDDGRQDRMTCPKDCALAQLKLRMEELRDTLARPPKEPPKQNLPEGCCKQKMFKDVCCDNLWRLKSKQQYKVTVAGEVVGPLWPPSVKQPILCPPCVTKRPAMDPSHACYKPPGAGPSPGPQLGAPKKKYVETRGEGTCPERNFYSVSRPKPCPPQHRHWSPECTTCRYPNSCRADCTSHPTCGDWVYRQPSYRYYLQNRDYRPFQAGF